MPVAQVGVFVSGQAADSKEVSLWPDLSRTVMLLWGNFQLCTVS